MSDLAKGSIKIGVISDTHSYFDDRIIHYLKDCNQIWHAGDVGRIEVLEQLSKLCELRAVSGNIDGQDVRMRVPKVQFFSIAGKKVLMLHIGGYPPRYNKYSLPLINKFKPDIYVCGHSHILKVQYDESKQLLHINPGAAGKHGFHKVRTLVTFEIIAGKIGNLQVVELGKH